MKLRLAAVAAIWVAWLGAFFIFTTGEVDKSHIETRSGLVKEASCITSRSVNGLDFVISNKDGRKSEEFLNLPGSYKCEDDIAEEFVGQPARLSKYKERYVGLTIGDTVILDVNNGVKRASDKRTSILFSFFLAFIVSILIIIRRR